MGRNLTTYYRFREGSVVVMRAFGHPELGNLVGLISLLIVLLIWRKFKKIPLRLVDTNNKVMKESGLLFTYLCRLLNYAGTYG